eukprot:1155018-Pelagomonas_calceolata.AAC.7
MGAEMETGGWLQNGCVGALCEQSSGPRLRVHLLTRPQSVAASSNRDVPGPISTVPLPPGHVQQQQQQQQQGQGEQSSEQHHHHHQQQQQQQRDELPQHFTTSTQHLSRKASQRARHRQGGTEGRVREGGR